MADLKRSTKSMKAFHLIGSLLLLAVGAHADVLFRGYVITAEQPLVILSVGQKTSDWLAVGQSFEGFTVAKFEAKGECLTVEKDGATQLLPLAAGRLNPGERTAGEGLAAPDPSRQAAERYARMLSKSAVVVLADVWVDEELIHVMPRESWKNPGVSVGLPIEIRRSKNSSLTPGLPPCQAIVWFSQPTSPHSWGIAFSDGTRIGGPQGPAVADIREKLRNLPDQPPAVPADVPREG